MDAKQLQIGDLVQMRRQVFKVLAISAPNHNGDRYLELKDVKGLVWHNITDANVSPITLTKELREAFKVKDQRFIYVHHHQQWLRLVDATFRPDEPRDEEDYTRELMEVIQDHLTPALKSFKITFPDNV